MRAIQITNLQKAIGQDGFEGRLLQKNKAL
jgi:hypothetical protein